MSVFTFKASCLQSLSRIPGEPHVLHIVTLSQTDIASVQGLTLRYWSSSESPLDPSLVRTLHVDAVNMDLSTVPPVPPPFVAEWEGVLHVSRYGTHQLHLSTTASGFLEIDGVKILSGQGGQFVDRTLARGNHQFRLLVHAKSGREHVRLTWPESPTFFIS